MGKAIPASDLECFTDTEVAKILRCSIRHVVALRLSGKLRFVRIGRCVRIFRTDLAKYIGANASTGGAK